MSYYFPTDKDTRALWAELAPKLPANCDLILADKNLYGLGFYSGKRIVEVTNDPDTRRFFVAPKKVPEAVSAAVQAPATVRHAHQPAHVFKGICASRSDSDARRGLKTKLNQ